MKFVAFNVENLFSRPKAMNLSNHRLGMEKLELIADLQRALAEDTYDKSKIVRLANQVRGYFKVNKTRGRNPLSWSESSKSYSVKVNGRDKWDGFIELTRDRFDFTSVKNTGKFMRGFNADIVALCEVEGSSALRAFRSDQLSREGLKYDLVIDGNDPRGIDVGILSTLPMGNLRTNKHRKRRQSDRRSVFSRDCLEVQFELPNGESVWVLQNHLLSKLKASNDTRRGYQAEVIAEILEERYDLNSQFVIVSGDLNDDIDSRPLRPLKDVRGLSNVLDLAGVSQNDQWTYYYSKEDQKNRIDYVLVSDALSATLKDAGVDRRGIAGIDRLTGGAIQPLSGITNWRNAASDHAAVWAEFDL